MVGGQRLNIAGFSRRSMFIVRTGGFKNWLAAGYPLVLGYFRLRTFGGLVKGMFLLGSLSILTGLLNLAAWLRRRQNAHRAPCSSATIIMDI